MVHKKIRIPKENANEILFAIGKIKNGMEFEDLTKNDLEAKKAFSDMIKRCDEVKKNIDEFIQIFTDFSLQTDGPSTFNEINAKLSLDIQERDKKHGSTYFDLVESEIAKTDRKIKELLDSHEQVRENLNILFEKNHVLRKVTKLITSDDAFKNFGENESEEEGIIANNATNLVLVAGIIPIENEMKFKRMVFRVSRGNASTAFYSLEISPEEYFYTTTLRQRALSNSMKNDTVSIINSELYQNTKNKKKIFSVVFAGGSEGILLKKILKVCEIFQASRFNIPKTTQVTKELNALSEDIDEKKSILQNIERSLMAILKENNQFKECKGIKYTFYKLYFEQQRLIYLNLGKCILRENFIDGRVWIPKYKLHEVESVLNNLYKDKENKINASLIDIDNEFNSKPPTLILVNEFTSIPQLIVDTYGVPSYKEINPGYFTIITFPFLFGVMFGDIGHSLFILCLAIYLLANNKTLSKSSNSMVRVLAQARYFLLLMAFFSLYCGTLYNDFLSVPLYFKSCYPKTGKKEEHLDKDKNCKYHYGLDPVWYTAHNELAFVNSLKMKFSVIIGLSQMTLGIIMKGINSLYEKNMIDFFLIFIPELIFMLIFFGYMDALIFLKWTHKYDGIEDQAPDIKSFLMNMVLEFGKLPSPPAEGKDWELYGSRAFFERLHLIFLIVGIACLLIMLVPPIFLNYKKAKNKNKKRMNEIMDNEANEILIRTDNDDNNENQENNEPKISDFVVASVIETIEFALGAVSNTASYLRLWALSLAHSQLAAVFFEYGVGMLSRFKDNPFVDGILLSVVFVIFGSVTFFVLLCMDLMECFLHTLRLHWVEFQNKFFKAEGHKFRPFSFEINLQEENEEAD